MLRTEAVKNFLLSTGNLHLTELYNYEMEVQVNVARDGGRVVRGEWLGKRWRGWTDGETTWKSFRVPFSADSNPNYTDREMKFDLSKHAEAIGMTGWNWKRQESLWVGFDFDSIVNHKQAGLEESELNNIRDMVIQVPWVTLLKSTSGKGLHIYIHFEEPISTATHTEHAALARSVLTLLSAEIGYNLDNSVDICGGVLWCFHRKQQGTDGLSLLKGGKKLPALKIPPNWKDHVEVTSKKRLKTKAKKDPVQFESLVSSLVRVELDTEHRQLLKWFCDNTGSDYDWWWDSDYNMLVCHTHDLAKAHKELNLRGFFYTDSTGSSAQNCFCFPAERGAWTVRRHGIGTKEHPSWVSDPSGWTRVTYNAAPEIDTCIRANKGIENSKGEFVFSKVKEGVKALWDYEVHDFNIPEEMHYGRKLYIKYKGESKLIVSVDALPSDKEEDFENLGFLLNKKRWERVVPKNKPKKETSAPDHLIRHLISNGAEAGWFVKINHEWILQNKSNVTTVLKSQSWLNDIDEAMGKSILQPWYLVNKPFKPEYPGDRQWNKDAATLSIDSDKIVPGIYDTWLKVIEHCGKLLDMAVQDNEWCEENGIETGSDYLQCWIASMFQKPEEPLPYLFFVGTQNTGKSTLHEALSLLFKKGRGYVRADNALTNRSGFNGELENAVLCVVEETNLSKNKDANNRIKDWVTGRTISIRHLYQNSFDIANTSHWIQCANDLSFCPVLPGDTRIVVVPVPELEQEMSKKILFEKLEQEKAAFLDHIMSIELPEPQGRLAVPCISTSHKEEIESYNSTDLERFMHEKIKVCKGHCISFEDFVNAFYDWLEPSERMFWTKHRIGKEYPKSHPYCKGMSGGDNKVKLGNVTFDLDAKPKLSEEYIYESKTKRIKLINPELLKIRRQENGQ